MARDDFSRTDIDRMAKRVGMKCSSPDCRRPTSGPDSEEGVTNIGVAAHITAASPGGVRYDADLTPEQRSHPSNGIWLCQVCAKIIDDDELKYSVGVLRFWKETAELMASLESRGFEVRRASRFPDLERKAPKLIAEMRDDLTRTPLVRQFVLLDRSAMYSPGSPQFIYYHDDHEFLRPIMIIMQNIGAIYDASFNNVPRYNFTEDFVSFLIGGG